MNKNGNGKILINMSYCEHCGHSQEIANKFNKDICTWCGNWIFGNDKAKFKYELSKALKKRIL